MALSGMRNSCDNMLKNSSLARLAFSLEEIAKLVLDVPRDTAVVLLAGFGEERLQMPSYVTHQPRRDDFRKGTHGRRKFEDAEATQPVLAQEGGAFLGAIYGEEEKAQNSAEPVSRGRHGTSGNGRTTAAAQA